MLLYICNPSKCPRVLVNLYSTVHTEGYFTITRALAHALRSYRSPGSRLLTCSTVFYLCAAYPAHITLSNKTEMDLG